MAFSVRASRIVLLAATVLGVCVTALSAAERTDPQEVIGPCRVKSFFLVTLGTTNTDMVVANLSQPCQFIVFNPGLDRISNAALITAPPHHGHAEATLLNGRIQVGVTYTPEPGFTGSDTFTTTVEPSNKALIVHVDVRPQGSVLD